MPGRSHLFFHLALLSVLGGPFSRPAAHAQDSGEQPGDHSALPDQLIAPRLAGPLVFCSFYFMPQVIVPPVLLNGMVVGEWTEVMGTHYDRPDPYPNEHTLSNAQIRVNRAKERNEFEKANTLLFNLMQAEVEVQIKIFYVGPMRPLSTGEIKVLTGKIVSIDPFQKGRNSVFYFLEKGKKAGKDPKKNATEIGIQWLREIRIGDQETTTRETFDQIRPAITQSKNKVVREFLETGKFDLRKFLKMPDWFGDAIISNYPLVKDFLLALSRSGTPVRVTDKDDVAQEGVLIYRRDWMESESILLPEMAENRTIDTIYLSLVSEKSYDLHQRDRSKKLEVIGNYHLRAYDISSTLSFPSNIKSIEILL